MANIFIVLIIGLLIAAAVFAVLWGSGTWGRVAAVGLALVTMMVMCAGVLFTTVEVRENTARRRTVAVRMDETRAHERAVRQAEMAYETAVDAEMAVAEMFDAEEVAVAEVAEGHVHDSVNGPVAVLPHRLVIAPPVPVAESPTPPDFPSRTRSFTSTMTRTYPAHAVNTVKPTVAIGAIALVGLVVVLLIVAMIGRSSSAGWVAAAFIGVILVAGVFYSFRTASYREMAVVREKSHFDSQSSHPYLYGTESLPGIQSRLDGETNELWTPAANDTLSAETYASLKQLGRGVGSQVVNKLKEAKHPPQVIQVQIRRESAGGVEIDDAVTGCVERLKSEFPEIDINGDYSGKRPVKFPGDGTPGYGATVDLTLQPVTRDTAPWDTSANEAQYKIRTTLNHDGDQVRFENELFEKPWVDDLGSYLVSRPSYMLIRARSNQLANQPSQARRQAERAAAAEIVPQLQAFFTSRFPHAPAPGEAECLQQLEGAIINDEVFVIDRFPQAVKSRNQRMWREAILLNVNTDGLDEIASRMVSVQEVREVRRTSLAAGMAVLFIVILACGFVLNSLTKGYYQNRIGIGIGVGVVILCFLVIA